MSSFGPEIRREWRWEKMGKTYEVSVSPLHAPHKNISRLHILRDITQRKQLEAQLQLYSQRLESKVAEQAEKLLQQERLALLGQISAGLAHEIRTPLGAIITGIKILKKNAQQGEESEMIFALLKRETARLERKVQEFLSYAKPRLPQVAETLVSSLFEEIESVLSTDRRLVGDVRIVTAIEPPLLTWSLDGDRMKEALLNICINALQALQGKGTLRLEARCYYDRVLEIFVRDNGPGIPSAALPHIFEPFYSRRPEGTGLGLAISKDIIENHRGHVTVTSIPNLLTTFRITLRKPFHDTE
jgi:signal transduction histidine kinase